MGGDRPKVVYEVAGRSMVSWVVRACQEAGIARCIVVVGYRASEVKQALAGEKNCAFVEQTEQLGTGHATRVAQPLFAGQPPCDVIVLPGDGPLIQGRTLQALIKAHQDSRAVATLATAILDDPTGYGRVIRNTDRSFKAIVEQKDATEEQKKVREINTGYYCFRSDRLFQNLASVTTVNAQGEYYLTDVPSLLLKSGEKVAVVDTLAPEEVMGVNNPQQLAEVDKILRSRIAQSSGGKPATRESA